MNAVKPKLELVYQMECVISNTNRMATGSFGPCYVLVGHDPQTKYSFLAHIDAVTDIATITDIFQKLRCLGVDTNNLANVRLMGGWKAEEISSAMGDQIITSLKKEGIFDKVDFSFFQKKAQWAELSSVPDQKQLPTYFYPGGIQDPESGKFQFFAKPWKKIEDQKMSKIIEFYHAQGLLDKAVSNPSIEDMIAASERLEESAGCPLTILIV